MKILPLLALFAIGSPALANDVITMKSNNGYSIVVRRENVWCNKEIFTYECGASGIMTDLLGNRSHWSGTPKDCYSILHRPGEPTHGNVVKSNHRGKYLVCQAAWSFGGK